LYIAPAMLCGAGFVVAMPWDKGESIRSFAACGFKQVCPRLFHMFLFVVGGVVGFSLSGQGETSIVCFGRALGSAHNIFVGLSCLRVVLLHVGVHDCFLYVLKSSVLSMRRGRSP